MTGRPRYSGWGHPRELVDIDTGAIRVIVRACRTCGLTMSDVDLRTGYIVVSPQGTAHNPGDEGATDCGRDATRDGWLWPL